MGQLGRPINNCRIGVAVAMLGVGEDVMRRMRALGVAPIATDRTAALDAHPRQWRRG